MKAKPAPKHSQATFLYPDLIDQLNPRDPLLQLADKIPLDKLEAEFAPLYAERGRPAKPVRLMVGLLILKQYSGSKSLPGAGRSLKKKILSSDAATAGK